MAQYVHDHIGGWQPKATGGPEGQNPPSGGSNVQPPPELPSKKDIQVAIDALWACRRLIIDWPYESAEALAVINKIDDGLKALRAREVPAQTISPEILLERRMNDLEFEIHDLKEQLRTLQERFSRHASDDTHRIVVGGY